MKHKSSQALLENRNDKNESRVVVRNARSEDIPKLTQLAENENMGTLSNFESTLVAEYDGQIAGFCRISTYNNTAYVNPIVIDPLFQKRGLGRFLMNSAREKFGTLRFVARGSAFAFYEKIGCVKIDWPEIDRIISADCDNCNMFDSCHPQPMEYAGGDA